MNSLEEYCIEFKVLALVRYPKDGFQYTFDNGAVFICWDVRFPDCG